MQKEFFIIIIIVAAITTSFFIFNSNSENFLQQNKNSNQELNDSNQTLNTEDKNFVDNTNHNQDSNENFQDSTGNSNNALSNSPQNQTSVCMLVRPGNLPDIFCDVNYISQEQVSLKITNNLGEKISTKIKLDTCTPQLTKDIENSQEENFVFTCENEDYFNQAIFLTYELLDGEKVEIGGFVSGEIEN